MGFPLEACMAEPKMQLKDPEEQREAGTSWVLIGIMCWLFAALVMFFHPAAWKLGKASFAEIALGLVLAGLFLFINGLRIRSKAS